MMKTTVVFRWWIQRGWRGAGQARVAGHTASQTPKGWIFHPAHQGDLGWMGHYQLSKQSIQGLINWTPILQSAANVVKTEYSTFTYFITRVSNKQTVTATNIVVSSKVTCSMRSWWCMAGLGKDDQPPSLNLWWASIITHEIAHRWCTQNCKYYNHYMHLASWRTI